MNRAYSEGSASSIREQSLRHSIIATVASATCDLSDVGRETAAGVGGEAWYGSNSTVYMRLRDSEEDY